MRVSGRSCVVEGPRHAWKLHAREPGDLEDACWRSTTVRFWWGITRMSPIGCGVTAGLREKATAASPVGKSFEESHCDIGKEHVPMNLSNNDGQLSAEREEGRSQIEENTRQLNTHLTQSKERASQGLAGVRTAAREHKEMRFTALLHHMTVDLLRESFSALKRKAAPGVDGVTWYEYEAGLEERLVFTAGSIAGPTGHSRREGSTSRSRTGGNAR